MPIEVLMPALSPTMKEGNLSKWIKSEGDKVAPGDVIAEIETDKATMEVEAVDEGVLGRILVDEGSKGVKVNALIAVMLEDGDEDASIEDIIKKHAAVEEDVVEETKAEPKAAPKAPKEEKAPARKEVNVTSVSQPVGGVSERAKASPLARRLAQEKGIDLHTVTGTGPKGRIVKRDIEQYGSGGHVVSRNPQVARAEAVSTMREVIARRLQESKQEVPHFYLTVDCSLDALLAARTDINAAANKDSEGKPVYKISVNDFVIKAVALAMRDVPEANASWMGEEIHYYNNVDISVAVAIEGGLITPIVQNADQKSLISISDEMKSLAKRARANDLSPEEFQGGGFSISNLGMFGIKQFNAIINPPQSCILAVGAGQEKPVIRDGDITKSTIMEVTLSSDHRVVDGAVGAEFMQAFKGYIERPVTMLI